MNGSGSPFSSPFSPRFPGGLLPRPEVGTPRGRPSGHRWSSPRHSLRTAAFSPTGSPCLAASPLTDASSWHSSFNTSVPSFTPSPGVQAGRGRHRSSFGTGPSPGGYDADFIRYATENPWHELEKSLGLSSELGPLNTGISKPQICSANSTTARVVSSSNCDDDDEFV